MLLPDPTGVAVASSARPQTSTLAPTILRRSYLIEWFKKDATMVRLCHNHFLFFSLGCFFAFLLELVVVVRHLRTVSEEISIFFYLDSS